MAEEEGLLPPALHPGALHRSGEGREPARGASAAEAGTGSNNARTSETCRVCRSGPTEGAPLFHPCRCSGSIAWVHQDCLEDWLRVSRKVACEICGHTYHFTKLYSADTPERLGWSFYLRALARRAGRATVEQTWSLLLAGVWLALVPLCVSQAHMALFQLPAWWQVRVVRGAGWASHLVSALLASPAPGGGESDSSSSSTVAALVHRLGIALAGDILRGHTIIYTLLAIGGLLFVLKEALMLEVVRAEQEQQEQAPGDGRVAAPPPMAPEEAQPVEALPVAPGAPAAMRPDMHLVILRQRVAALHVFREHLARLFPERGQGSASPAPSRRSNRESPMPEPRWPSVGAASGRESPMPEPRRVSAGTSRQESPMPEPRRASAAGGNSWDSPVPEPRRPSAAPVLEGNDVDAMLMARDVRALVELALQEGVEEVLGDLTTLTNLPSHLGLPPDLRRAQLIKHVVQRELLAAEQAVIQELQATELAAPPRQAPLPAALPVVPAGPAEDAVAAAVAGNPPNPLVNIDINVNINQDGNLEAQVMAQGDWNAFLDLIGYHSIRQLGMTALIVTGLLMAGVLLLLAVPYAVGTVTEVLWTQAWVPWLARTVRLVGTAAKVVTDPLLDPMVDLLWAWAGWLLLPLLGARSSSVALPTPSMEPGPSLADGSAARAMSEGTLPRVAAYRTAATFLDAMLGGQRTERIALGYGVLLALALVYVLHLGPRNNKYIQAACRIHAACLRIAGRTAKFAFFIVIELGLFPIFCGALIGALTLPLFGAGATVTARLAAYHAYPLLFLALCWLVGSSFMFRFASYVALLRHIVRPGVFWFIRDPNDPNFKPMVEILEKPMWLQLRKVALGVLLYSAILLCFVGGVTLTGLGLDWALRGLPEGSPLHLLPIRLVVARQGNESIVDGIFHQFCLPYFLQVISKGEMLCLVVRTWLRWAGRRLCLTNFLFGPPAPRDEEHLDPARNTYLRVPNHDHVLLVPGDPMMQPIGAEEPVFGRAGETADEVRANWTKVYVPPLFAARAGLLVALHLTAGVLACSGMLFGSILLGRSFLMRLLGSEARLPVDPPAAGQGVGAAAPAPARLAISDLYAMTFGLFFLLLALSLCLCLVRAVQHLLRHVRNGVRPGAIVGADAEEDEDPLLGQPEEWAEQQQGARPDPHIPEDPRTPFLERLEVRRLWKFLFFFLPVGIVLPFLVGTIVDIYMTSATFPVTFGSALENFTRWEVGCIALHVAYLVACSIESHVQRVLLRAATAGLPRTDVAEIMTVVVVPALLVALGGVALPFVLTWVAASRFGHEVGTISYLIKQGPMLIITGRLLYGMGVGAYSWITRWVAQLKDEEFLVGRTLRNVE